MAVRKPSTHSPQGDRLGRVRKRLFHLLTGEADPSSDYEIDEVLKGGGGETLVAQGFVDD